ncbi:AAA family ATPase [Streptococcus equi]|uniref:AAA family ATPase n=1 Tax=Streptococcus equi TaxID=1336 RepID=UPI0013F5CC82|nr:AAA family ATPase [Streptococcus equi]MDI5990269.1 AAA family ATPase [Streptococcus equi subsp. zooepidemicus]HEL0698099.1 AAA family ATPase [Streptococcus equi subsp. zooepidemicus]HEL0807774.1 AAA family ATPase [Streptococcus equi subsp. zooepidemicus]
MATITVGNSFDAVNFKTAYNIAQNGDILKFERGYKIEEPNGFIIEKSLNLVGTIGVTSNGQRSFSNVMEGYFVISEGAKVDIKNFWINPYSDDFFFLTVESKSSLTFDTIYVSNNLAEQFAFISSKQNSSIKLVNIEFKQNHNVDCFLSFSEGSRVSIENSSKLYGRLIVDDSEINIKNSRISTSHGNAVYAQNHSELILSNTEINSFVTAEEGYPAIWLYKSSLFSEGSKVTQNNVPHAIRLNNSSKLLSSGDTLASVILDHSIAYLEDSIIQYMLTATDKSYIKSKGKLTCLGELESKVEIFIDDDSSLVMEHIEFQSPSTPTIVLSNHSFGYAETVAYVSGDDTDIVINSDDNSQFIQAKGVDSEQHLDNEEFTSAEEELNNLVGLRQVKQMVEQMVNQVKANQKRIEKGLKPMQQNLNSVFLGNPGTGKTTVARLLGKVLYLNGALSGKDFKFIEVSEPDLISQNIGGTAIQTKAYLDQARGGILFIDEAYTLHKKDGTGFGQEAINTIMKYMEDYRNEIMIIFAGYTKEMEEFLKTNPGLLSRAPNRFIFEDYTAQEIIQLGEGLLEKDQFKLEDREYYAKQVAKTYNRSLDKSNGRWIRNFNESLTKEQFSRVVKTDSDDVETILNLDIDNVLLQGSYEASESEEDAMSRLRSLIGIKNVKRQVQEFIYQVEANQKKSEMGMEVSDFTLHSLFLGNPGTGKTTVARIIGNVLYQKGIIATKKFVEVSRSDLVAGYVGQTASKTREVLEAALGGVLFIDEAYTLNSSSSNDFGKEAIDEILKFMEDHRHDIVIIFAGYTKEMSEFLQMNSGLQSRIPTVFDFEDYTPDEIVEIGLLGLKDYQFDREFYADTVKKTYRLSDDKSNGRWIRNFNDKLLRIQSARLIEKRQDNFNVILNEDIENMIEKKN